MSYIGGVMGGLFSVKESQPFKKNEYRGIRERNNEADLYSVLPLLKTSVFLNSFRKDIF